MPDYRHGLADAPARAWFEMDQVERGRECYRRGAWSSAYQALLSADVATPLEADDLERLAVAAFLTGRDVDFQRLQERLHRIYVGADDRPRAARAAFWLAFFFVSRGDVGQSNAWIARGQRLVEELACVEQGYLMLPIAEQQLRDGRGEAAHATVSPAVMLGESFRDSDLTAAARHVQGRALLQQGAVSSGLTHLDETMLAVVAGDLSPLMTGLLYCSVIDACRAGLRARPGARMDLGFFARLRATAGDAGLHRHLPGPPCRDHAAAGGVAGRAERSASRL